MLRSYLYAPAANARLLEKVEQRGADAVVLDLEDGVAPDQKDLARERLGEFLAVRADRASDASPTFLVRINREGTGWSREDLEVAVAPATTAISLPKAESPDEVRALADELTGLEQAAGVTRPIGLHLLIESAVGVEALEPLARCPRVLRFGLGAADLAADLGLRVDAEHRVFDHIRGRLVVASRAAGLQPPVDAVSLHIHNPALLATSATYARDRGFFGKSVVHPAQVDVVNDVFTPDEDEVARAEAIVAASMEAEAAGSGAVVLDGQLVDAPVVIRARAILDLDRRLASASTKPARRKRS